MEDSMTSNLGVMCKNPCVKLGIVNPEYGRKFQLSVFILGFP